MAGPRLPERIAQCYYTHGLLCSSHPIVAIAIAISCFSLCCYPLLNLPLPGSIPLKVYLPYTQHETQKPFNDMIYSFMYSNSTIVENPFKNVPENSTQDNGVNQSNISLSALLNETARLPYLWAKDQPLVYVQQIILKTGVWPWRDELKLSDAFRAPLQEVFRLLETVRNHQQQETGTTLGHLCFHVESVKRNFGSHNSSPVLPEYSCLVLSPANLWQQNVDKFLLDANVLSTVFSHQNLQKGKVSTAEMVFGMPLKDTGIKRYPFKARPRALQYALTLFFQKLDENYIDSLKEKLSSAYPLHHKWDKSQSNNQITLIYYPGEFNYHEFIPLCLTFIGLFIYIYFSMRKLEFIRSKIGLSISAVASIAASLIMTIGFCFFFGLTLSFQGKEIFPYLVILVGMENVFVLTKSVMSIDFKLDVKIRLAQGLSKEGWSITKNLLVEITILTICLFTFIPVVQHICIFMIVSLLCDFFLQMLFFSTVLGIDIRRKEELREKTSEFQLNQRIGNQGKFFIQDFTGFSKLNSEGDAIFTQFQPKIKRSKSHPRLNGLANHHHTNVVANFGHESSQSSGRSDKKTPKRILLVKIWARTRFFQRAFMVWMVIWISMIIYNSGIIENIFDIANIIKKNENSSIINNQTMEEYRNVNNQPKGSSLEDNNVISIITENNDNKSIEFNNQMHIQENSNDIHEEGFNKTDIENIEFNSEILNKTLHLITLKHMSHFQPWLRLSEFHWSSVLSQYNISVSGRYLAVLPPILVKHRVTPEKAAAIRNPSEKDNITPPSRWRALAAALDPIDLIDFEIEDGIHIPHIQLQAHWGIHQSPNDIPYYPTSPMEFLFLAILCCISVLVITYTMVVIYRCVCTKNYAEWRSSWTKLEYDKQYKKPALQFVMEAAPTVVSGHTNEIECLAASEEKIVSCCLQGQVKVWNPANGELLTQIDRHGFFRTSNYKSDYFKYQIISTTAHQSYDDSVIDSSVSIDCPQSTPSNDTLRKRSYLKQNRFSGEIPFTIKPIENHQFTPCIINSYSKDRSLLSLHDIGSTNIRDGCYERSNFHLASSKPLMKSIHSMETVKTLPNTLDSSDCDLFNLNVCDNISTDHLKCSDHNHPISVDNIGDIPDNEGKVVFNTLKSNKQFLNLIDNDAAKKNVMLENLNKNIISNYTDDGEIINSPEFSKKHSNFSTGPPSIWCMDFADDLIVLGCSNGQLEFWDASNGSLKGVYDDGIGSSINFIKLMEGTSSCGMHVIVARLSGYLELFLLENPPSFQNTHKRTHIRTGSAGSIVTRDELISRYSPTDPSKPSIYLGKTLQCRKLASVKAHQQPINGIECDGGKIITGSQDHSLKVFSSYDLTALYTLHGHCGPITCIFIDRFCPTVSGSGSEDGLLCVWDLMTGACMYSKQAHDGPITELVYSESYVISMGADEKLCIWDRFRGHLLNSMNIGQGAGNCGMLSLTHSLIVTGGLGGLTVWDASTGEPVRRVVLGSSDGCIFVRKILPLRDAIVCDYANELRIVRFPIVSRIEQFERKNN